MNANTLPRGHLRGICIGRKKATSFGGLSSASSHLVPCIFPAAEAQAELLLALLEQHLWLSADSWPLAASPAQPRGLYQQKGGEGWKWGFMRGVSSVTSALELIGAVLPDLCFQMG